MNTRKDISATKSLFQMAPHINGFARPRDISRGVIERCWYYITFLKQYTLGFHRAKLAKHSLLSKNSVEIIHFVYNAICDKDGIRHCQQMEFNKNMWIEMYSESLRNMFVLRELSALCLFLSYSF